MPDEHEELYAALRVDASSAWARLHADVTSQLTAQVELPTAPRRIADRSRARVGDRPGPGRSARRPTTPRCGPGPPSAPCAPPAMNSIKGEAVTLNRRRGWPDALDAALFANNVGRKTFDAMQAAVVHALPDFRRWMRAKAALHGTSAAPWWDLVAPLPVAAPPVRWGEGVDLVRDAFDAYAPRLGQLVDRAVARRWLDVEPRARQARRRVLHALLDDRSLVMMNWTDGLDSVQTLAHELGHAFHNTRLAARTPLQRQVPMALAETASIFCETLMVEAVARRGDRRRTTRRARRRPAGRDAGRRRHPQPVPVRAGGVRPP